MRSIEDKIKKLLNLANDAGASENEAEVALAMAQKLAAKHAVDLVKIQTGKIDDSINIVTIFSERQKMHAKQRILVVLAALYPCRAYVHQTRDKTYEYRVVVPSSLEMAVKNTFEFILSQVEKQCKESMPPEYKGTKMRREYYKTFRWACVSKLIQRAQDLQHKLTTDNDFAKAEAGTTAIAIKESRNTILDEAAKELKNNGIYLVRGRRTRERVGRGTSDGMRAGSRIALRQSLS